MIMEVFLYFTSEMILLIMVKFLGLVIVKLALFSDGGVLESF